MVHTVKAVCDGEVIKLESVSDEVFSSGMLGKGFAIIPNGKDFVSPIDGRVTEAHEAGHAYAIAGNDGIEILVHIGIDTVELDGEGFAPVVKSGMSVLQCDKLTYADTEKIIGRGFDPVTVVVITNSERMKDFKINYGKVKAGETVLEYTL